jgi:hypothetical protein
LVVGKVKEKARALSSQQSECEFFPQLAVGMVIFLALFLFRQYAHGYELELGAQEMENAL